MARDLYTRQEMECGDGNGISLTKQNICGESSKVWYLVFTCLPLRKKSRFLAKPCDIGGARMVTRDDFPTK